MYYLNLPVLYADEFDAGSFRGEVFQTLHSFLRAKDVDYTDIDNYESVKQSVRNIDISRFVKFHPNSTKKSKNEYEVRREQRLVYWIMRFKERTTTIPSVVSIIRQIMSVDM